MHKELPFQVSELPKHKIFVTHARMQENKLIIHVSCVKENIFSPLQVKNKLHDGETEHAFILGSMDCMVAKSFVLYIYLDEVTQKQRIRDRNVVFDFLN
jgi:hypothetical protein